MVKFQMRKDTALEQIWVPSNRKWSVVNWKPESVSFKTEVWLLHIKFCSFCDVSFSVVSEVELVHTKTKCLGNSIWMAFLPA